MQVVGSRLAILISTEHGTRTVITWNWNSAQVLFVCQPLRRSTSKANAPTQVLNDGRDLYSSVEFIDDYRLLVGQVGPTRGEAPCLVLIDTEKDVGGVPIQTVFRLSQNFRECPLLQAERGAHKQSHTENMVPFHRDPNQRVVVLSIPYGNYQIVFQSAPLLKLAKGREGCEIGWDEWKDRLLILSFRHQTPLGFCMSGSRLFYVMSTREVRASIWRSTTSTFEDVQNM